MTAPLSAPLRVGFDYTRSLGPVLGHFMTELRSHRVVGVRGSDGRVHVPPIEYDPVTAEPLSEFVPVASSGTVVTWTWMSSPLEGQPFDRPFAWAMVLLDGADTPLLHAVDVTIPAEMSTGMRVRIRWNPTPTGGITDIACFEPVDPHPAEPSTAAAPPTPKTPPADRLEQGRPPGKGGGCAGGVSGLAPGGEVSMVTTPISLDVLHSVSPEESRYLRGLAEGRLLGQRCPRCRKVYIPPRGACPVDGVPTVDEVELPDTGIVTTFCIVNVPFLGQRINPPYVAAYILLDGADIAFLHLVLGCDADNVTMGMRVRAVWKPQADWGTTLENIEHFTPTGEPDADYDTFAGHL
ncbi:Zn-ribbon domain-containing OB-fold protein [Actinokineospora sp. HUAS TT18]|uniref:Zn-ribbon domain-containing OB-fold protein n=1 Tax=Actinokineospora sp. HUAS TT18 TaxID=3447451 RepID=UPI003F52828F